jgi:hypothetical protein
LYTQKGGVDSSLFLSDSIRLFQRGRERERERKREKKKKFLGWKLSFAFLLAIVA